jgi:hypothetical protein
MKEWTVLDHNPDDHGGAGDISLILHRLRVSLPFTDEVDRQGGGLGKAGEQQEQGKGYCGPNNFFHCQNLLKQICPDGKSSG